MQTPAEFLKTLGESLARFDRPRVAKIGCFTAIGVLAALILAGAAGVMDPHPLFPRFFRLAILSMLGTTVVVFVLYAAIETLAERRARAEIQSFLSNGGTDLATLVEMARTRQGRFPGSGKVIEILERASAFPAPRS